MANKNYKIAVVGATGSVGREMLDVLYERSFPASEVVAIASRESIGKKVSFGESEELDVIAIENYDFSGTDIALFSAGEEISKIYAKKAASLGCVVVDNGSFFRMNKDVPLIIPEVNIQDLKNYTKTNIIANPNCTTIQMLVALKPLHDMAKIKRIIASTYQSTSGAGKEAMDELYNQTKGSYLFNKIPPKIFNKQIAFNIIPQIDEFLEDGTTKEEQKIVNETAKILDPAIQVFATCVRVPVFVGHSVSLNVEFENEITPTEARNKLKKSKAIMVVDNPGQNQYKTPIEIVKEDEVYVSRIRKDPTCRNSLSMWVVCDNLRKGAALNAVQICEELIKII